MKICFVPWITHAPRGTNSPLAADFETWSASTANADALASPALQAFENATAHWAASASVEVGPRGLARGRVLDDDARRAMDVRVDVPIRRD